MQLAKFVNWNGTADEFVALAKRLTKSESIFHGQPVPNVRVLRDYVQRKIVDVPERRGREAIYSYRHLLQFLAAKALLADNWPLRKIAEALPHMADDRLAALLGESVVGVERSIKPSDDEEHLGGGLIAGMVTHAPFSLPQVDTTLSVEMDHLNQKFQDHAEDIMQKRSDLNAFRRMCMLEGDPPPSEEWTKLTITERMVLLIETDELKALSFKDADWIGRAVSATLYRYMTDEREKK